MSVDVGRSQAQTAPSTDDDSMRAPEPIPNKSMLVKTDKPRPHVCSTCTRSFARLEHLKRHERSHTKEKPFQCPVCERCFARRDLLLRHKQKLHASFPPTDGAPPVMRPRSASVRRKPSTASSKSGTPSSPPRPQPAQRSGSVPNAPPVTTQPYSNLLRSQLGGIGMPPTPTQSLPDMSRPRPASFSAASATSYSKYKDIESFNNSNMFPTGPQEVSFSTPQLLPVSIEAAEPHLDGFSMSDPLFINPQLLGKQDSPRPNGAPPNHPPPVVPPQQGIPNHHRPSISSLSNASYLFSTDDRYKVDEDLSPNSVLAMEHDDLSWMPPSSNGNYARQTPQSILNNASSFSPPPQDMFPGVQAAGGSVDSPLSVGITSTQSNPMLSPPGQSTASETGENTGISPRALLDDPQGPASDVFQLSSSVGNDMRDHKNFSSHIDGMDFGMVGGPDGWTQAGQRLEFSETGNANHVFRMANPTSAVPIAAGANQPGHRGQIITPQLRLHILATLSTPTPFNNQHPQLPSTLELQRYINSYTENFGKHMPFLHHTLEFTPDNVPLALGMAAIGALYTFEHANSINIFEISRSCVHVYLESCRESKSSSHDGQSPTPLWLVQALVLGVIYGLFSNEYVANEIAMTQANAVVSLAKSAGLNLSPSKFVYAPDFETAAVEDKWRYFINVQERIRTMHVVHMVSCLLATSYNVSSTLKKDDIKCGSPCDESMWTAVGPLDWWDVVAKKSLDRSPLHSFEGPLFQDCLQQLMQRRTLMEKIPQFTLLSLLYAIHYEIFERRSLHNQRFAGHSPQSPNGGVSQTVSDQREAAWLEREKVDIECVMRAWETTWSLSPLASLSPSSQYGPLMSDAIPLSSLAHVRIYVDLSKVKAAFWKRDFDLLSRELDNLGVPSYYEVHDGMGKRFNGLLEAASYAADAISLWEKHSVKWTLETTASQTFIHTLVSLFDCGLAVSEFLNRLERQSSADWAEDEALLVSRVGKIFYRVLDVVGHDGLEPFHAAAGMNGGRKERHGSMSSFDMESDLRPLLEDGTLRVPGKLSVLTLLVVAKILCKTYIWPFAVVMGEALQFRARELMK